MRRRDLLLMFPALALGVAACGDGSTVMSNGQDGNLRAMVRVDNGVVWLRPLPGGEVSELSIDQREKTDDAHGRNYHSNRWTTVRPHVTFEPASVAQVEIVSFNEDTSGLVLSISGPSGTEGVLRVRGDVVQDSWLVRFE